MQIKNVNKYTKIKKTYLKFNLMIILTQNKTKIRWGLKDVSDFNIEVAEIAISCGNTVKLF